MKIIHGDCIEKLKELDDNSIDSIVTDPPYGLGFMGKDWDTFDKSQFGKKGEEGENDLKNKKNFKILPRYNTDGLYDFTKDWAKECYRVLKPGGHLLSFAGSRTYHKICMGVEDAGFEIRDQIMWIYGSGFPKSMNISKQIDKKNGQSKIELKFVEWYRTVGISAKETNKIIGTKDTGSHYLRLDQPYLPTKVFWEKLKPHITVEIPNWVDKLIERVEAEREVIEKKRVQRNSSSWDDCSGMLSVGEQNFDITAPATDEAKQWNGWGTALKPAHEPIVMARKPLSEKTVVDNVLEWGTGGINIDGSRIETDETLSIGSGKVGYLYKIDDSNKGEQHIAGRFPANIILDEEAGKILDEQSGNRPGCTSPSDAIGSDSIFRPNQGAYQKQGPIYGDNGGASRFFYCPKTSKTDRNEGLEDFKGKQIGTYNAHSADLKNYGGSSLGAASMSGNNKMPQPKQNFHPTVKPTDLMLYLIRMVTPKGGTTLDPFMGSGSTGKAAVRGGFDFVGIEREQDYKNIAEARIQYEIDNPYNEEKGERIKINKNANKFW